MKMTNRDTSSILSILEKKSASNYEKVARRMRIAIQIADAMQSVGLSKKQFADKIGKHPSEITKWLSGTHNFTSDTLTEISCVLGVEITGAKQTAMLQYDNYNILSNRFSLASTEQRYDSKKISISSSMPKWNKIFQGSDYINTYEYGIA